jgi:hypothetical protein
MSLRNMEPQHHNANPDQGRPGGALTLPRLVKTSIANWQTEVFILATVLLALEPDTINPQVEVQFNALRFLAGDGYQHRVKAKPGGNSAPASASPSGDTDDRKTNHHPNSHQPKPRNDPNSQEERGTANLGRRISFGNSPTQGESPSSKKMRITFWKILAVSLVESGILGELNELGGDIRALWIAVNERAETSTEQDITLLQLELRALTKTPTLTHSEWQSRTDILLLRLETAGRPLTDKESTEHLLTALQSDQQYDPARDHIDRHKDLWNYAACKTYLLHVATELGNCAPIDARQSEPSGRAPTPPNEGEAHVFEIAPIEQSANLADQPRHAARTMVDFEELSPHEYVILRGENLPDNLRGSPACIIELHHQQFAPAEEWRYTFECNLTGNEEANAELANWCKTVGLPRRYFWSADLPEALLAQSSLHDAYSVRAIGDNGSTICITSCEDLFEPKSLRRLSVPMRIKGLSGSILAAQAGTVVMVGNTKAGKDTYARLTDFYYAPDLPEGSRTLVGLSVLADLGYYLDIGGGGLRIRKGPNGNAIFLLPRDEETNHGLLKRDTSNLPLRGPVDFGLDMDQLDRQRLYPIPDICFKRLRDAKS